MTLPKLETPTYEITIPSTKEEILFRPFLVKEEKILLMAQESKDQREILRALKEIVRSCTFDKVNPDDLTSYDLEYIFLKLRGKSVGEIVQLDIKCAQCEAINPLDISLEEVQIKYPEKAIDPTIQLSDTVGIVARPVPMKDVSSLKDSNDITELIALCIDSIFDGNKIFKRTDITNKELMEFVESLSRQHVQQIEAFIMNQPRLEHSVSYTCHSCGKTTTMVLSGLQDFFK